MIRHLAQDTQPNIQEPPQQDMESKGGSTSTRPIRFFNVGRVGVGIINDVRARAWYLSD